MSITKVKLRYTQNIWFFVIFSEYNFKWVWWTCLVFMVLKAPFINLLIPSRWDVGHRMSSSWSKTTRTNKARRLKLHQEWVTSVGLWWWWKVLVYASFSLSTVFWNIKANSCPSFFPLADLDWIQSYHSLNWVLFPLAGKKRTYRMKQWLESFCLFLSTCIVVRIILNPFYN